MKTNIIRIGNSRGIRLPKVLLEECGFDENTPIEIKIKNHQIVIKLYEKPRAEWAEAFKKMAQHKDDLLLDKETENQWDKEEWKW